MKQTLDAMTKKVKRQKMRESTAEEWAKIVQQANVERVDYWSTLVDDLVDDQTEKQAEVELKTEIESQCSSVSISRKKRKTPRYMKTFGTLTNYSKNHQKFRNDRANVVMEPKLTYVSSF